MIKAARLAQKKSALNALELARRVLAIEADAVRALIERLDERFLAALELVAARTGRVVVSGIGKSGHIARKIASTMASTGTPAYFVHAAEASHGDLGMIEAGDVFIAISYSGASDELLDIVPLVKRRGAKLIAITGNASSALVRVAEVMHTGDDLPAVQSGSSGMQAVAEISRGRLGMTAVIDAARRVQGIFTDGDLRRALEKGIDLAAVAVDQVMTPRPRTLSPQALAAEAVRLLEAHKISQLLVVDERGTLLGALNMHDLFRAKVI